MKRSLLAKVGSHLAPDAFQYVLDAEDFSKGKLFCFTKYMF